MDTLKLTSGDEVMASIKVLTVEGAYALEPMMDDRKASVRFVGQRKCIGDEVGFEVCNYTSFDITIDILNTNGDSINKINLLRRGETIRIRRNEVLGCAMVLDEYLNNGKPLASEDEKKRCYGTIKVGFDRSYGSSHDWSIDNMGHDEVDMFSSHGRRVVCDGAGGINRALLKAGRSLEQVKYLTATTTDKFYATIAYDFGVVAKCCCECHV